MKGSFTKANTKAPPSLSSVAQDITLPSHAQDTISAVSWSPVANHLAAASWDGKVRVYDLSTSNVGNSYARAAAVATLSADGPLLDCAWAQDGTLVVAAGADKKLHLLHAATGQHHALADAHAQPIRGVRFVDVPNANANATGKTNTGAPLVASGSWDRTLKLWDLRQRRAAAALACAERVYALDARAALLVVATAGQHIHLVDMRSPGAFLRTVTSQMRTRQTKAVAAFPDGKGWATASIEGRCAVDAVDEADASKINFQFRCHRSALVGQTQKVWAVNAVAFHPRHATVFATAGSDGTYHFWDRVAHSRLRWYDASSSSSSSSAASLATSASASASALSSSSGAASSGSDNGSAITSIAFSRDGSYLAYAVGYDWSRGCHGNTPQIRTKLVLHPVAEDDVKARRKSEVVI